MRKGMWYAVAAYGLWGLVPIYWNWLKPISAVELIGHRIVWSCAALFLILFIQRDWRGFWNNASTLRALGVYSLAALLVGVNWLTYVWAVNAGYIVETSLGYFINPLVNILLGIVVFKEKLRSMQWLAVGLATSGVLYLTVSYGTLPWIALTLAFSFGLYGLVKKVAVLRPIHGLTLETVILLAPAIVYLGRAEAAGTAAFGHRGLHTDLLLIGAGLVTTVPLIFFAGAAQRIPLSWMGLFQYIAPTLQFLIGVFVFKEPFTRTQAVGFGAVWTALALLAAESLFARGHRPRLQ